MKKITLVLLLSLFSLLGYSQVPQGFEGGVIPAGWAVIHNGLGANQWTTSTATPVCEGTTSAFMNARQNLGAVGLISEDWLVSSQVTVPTNGQLRFCTRMNIAGNNSTQIIVKISTTSQTNLGSFVDLANYTDDNINTVYNENEVKVVSLNGFVGQQVYIAFVVKYTQPGAGINGDRLFLDDVKVVEQCIDPTDLIINAADITQTSAILDWTDNTGASQWEVQIFQEPGAILIGTGIANSHPISTANLVPPITLIPATSYQFYVRAICSLSVSQWVGPFNFATRSPGETCGSAISVTTPLPYSTSNNTSNFTDDLDGSPGATGCGTSGNFLNGNNVYYQYTATFTGVVNITMTPNPSVNNTGLFVYNSCANVGVSCIAGVANTNGTPRVIDLPVTSGQTYYIAISTSGTPNTFAYDLVLQQVNCPPPTNLTAVGGLSSVNLSWNGVGASSFEYVLQAVGGPIPTTPGIATTVPEANGVTQLFDGTPVAGGLFYQYWVRASCGDGTFSAWAGPFVFSTTLCEVEDVCNYTFIMSDSFGDGWNGATMQVRQNGIVVATLTGPTNDDDLNPISVTVPLCDGFPFDLFWNAGGTFAGEVRVSIVNDSGQTVYNMNTSSAALVGTVLYTDDLVQCGVAECLRPTAITTTNPTDTEITVNWTPQPGFATYEVVVSLTNTVPPIEAVPAVVVTANTATISGLNPATIYFVFVRTVCSDTNSSSWTAPVQFNTDVCPETEQCDYTFRMRDSFGDGWNGARMQVRQNGIVVATIGATFTAGAGPVDVVVPLCNGLPFDLFWSVGGTFAGEVRVEIINDSAQSVFNMNVTSAPLVGTVLYTDNLVECGIPECLQPTNIVVSNPNTFTLQVAWNANGGSNFQVIAVPAGSPAPTQGTAGTPATSPHTITGLNPSTAYDVYVRTLCTGVNPVSNWAGPGTGTTLPTCPQPTNLQTIGTTSNSEALLIWNNPSTATLFQVWILPTGAPAPTASSTGFITTSLGYNVANPFLTPSLPVGFYDFYVRAVCTPTDPSLITGPGGFYIPGQLEACAGVDVQLDTPTPGVINLCPGDSCVDLSATYLDTGQTNTYTVGTIPFEPPFPFTGGTQTSIETDDVWSPTIDLPFNFCFFGQNYTKALVGSNGVISFDIAGIVPGGTQNPSGGCAWAYTQTIPNAAFPIKNAIYGPYQDIDPGIENTFAIPNINYQILGEAPCRVFVVNFSQVAQFSGACNTDPAVGAQTSQIVMYETSNIIDVYVQRRVPCTSWNGGRAVIGIQNQAGSQAHFPPNRNTGTWTANNEAYRFTPAGPSNVTFQWLKDDEFYSSDLNINVCVSESTNMVAQAIYTACGGEETVTTSTVVLQVLTDLPVQDDVETCGFYTLPVLSVGNYFSEPNAMGTTYTSGDQISQTQTIYVYAEITSESGTCVFENSFDITILEDITPQFDAISDICLNGPAPSLPATSVDGYNGFWDPATIDTSIVGTTTYTFSPFGEPECIIEATLDVTIIDVPVDTLENQFVCVSFTLPTLTNGNYFTATNGGGTPLMAGDVINTDSTIYIYSQNGVCTAETSFTVTIGPIDVGTFADVIACDTYVLPELTLGNYYTDTMGGGEMLAVGSEITTTQLIYVYASTDEEGCNDEASFTVTINTIQVDQQEDVFVCDSYILLALIVGNYYDAPGGTGNMIAVGTEYTSDTTIYIYGETGTSPNCTSESSFTITVGPLDVGTFTDVIVCDSYTLPKLALGNYFTETNGGGTMLDQGSEVTTSQMIYVYAESGEGCNDEASFTVTINTIVADVFTDVTTCDSYMLQILSANNAYYDAAGGTGNMLDPLVPITTSQMVYVYAESGTTPNCTAESSFMVTINATPLVDTLTDVSVCDTYTLQTLTNGMYYSNSGGTGVIDPLVPITTTQMIYIYAQTGTDPNCFAETSFTVTVNTVVADVIPSVTVCDTYTLPALSANNAYYSASGGVGTLDATAPITSTQTIFVYAQSGTTPNCTAETSFTVTVNVTPQATTVPSATKCVGESFDLPTSIVGNYFSQPGGVNPITATSITTSQTIYIYASSGTAPNVCATETSFTVTFNSATADSLDDVEECGSYLLPALSTGNTYHTAPNGGGTMLTAGQEVTTSQVIYVFAQNGACTDETDFNITINGCVIQKGISPNGDGSNDFFDLSNFDVKNLEIFNRYGRKVYNKPNYSQEWYGQSNKGEELPDGTYYFVIEFNNEPTKTGWIYIIRENK